MTRSRDRDHGGNIVDPDLTEAARQWWVASAFAAETFFTFLERLYKNTYPFFRNPL